METYKCSMCGYSYDPAKGFLIDGIEPGTPFDQVPDDWTCPVCGAPKTEFVPMA